MKRFKMLMMMIAFLGTGLGFGQVDIIPTRTGVAGFPTWTDKDVAGTTYLQLLIANSSTVTPAMNFNNFTGETLSFKARTYGGIDAVENTLTVSISVDNGSTYIVLGTRTPASSSMVSQTSFDLSPYSGTQIRLRFSVAGTNDGVGVGVDDIAITGLVAGTTEPEINLQGNSNNIVSGATTTSIANNTNFGSAEVGVGSIAKNFAIQNTGTEQLDLTAASPYVTISGANASDFVLTSPPNTPIAAGANSTFEITFSPTALGSRNATVTIPNNDSDEGPYTFAISGTGTYSNQSQILDVTNYTTVSPEFNSSPEYINFIDATSTTTGKFIPMKLRIIDGADSDALPTVLTDLRISVIDLAAANQLAMIKTAILTTSGGTVISTATKVGTELVFSGMSGANVTADDDSDRIIHLRVSIEENQIIDQTKLIFQVTSATSSAGGSSFASANAGGAQTDIGSNAKNRLNVSATTLIFNAQPQTTSVNGTMPIVIVEAVDGNNRRDINYAGTASITSTGTMTGAPLSASFNLGLASFPSVVHTISGTALTLSASSGIFAPIISTTFNITEIVFVNGDYRTTGSGNWRSNNAIPAIWERFNGVIWEASNSPNYNTSNNMYIRNGHTITTGGSFGASVNLKVLSGGIFVSGQSSTTASIHIYDGGIMRLNATLRNNGSLEVENNGTLELNVDVQATSNLWTGTEIFHPNSNLLIKKLSDNIEFFNGMSVSANIFDGYSAAFGNVIVDISTVSTKDLNLLASTTSANLAHRDLIFRRSGGGKIRLSENSTVNSGIGGNFTIESSFANIINSKTSGTLNFSIGGDMNLFSGICRVFAGTNGTTTFAVAGNINLTNSSIVLNSSISVNASSTINLNGNLNVAASASLSNVNNFGNDRVNFTGSSLQLINIATTTATSNSNIVFNVTNGSNVQLLKNLRLGNNGSFNVLDGGTLDFGFNGTTALNISRAGTPTGTKFSSEQGSTLKITSPDGISSTSGTVGNVQTTITPTYNSVATFWYQGKDHQVTGSGLPTSSSAKIVYVDLLNNSLTLTPTASVGISNTTTLDALGGRLEILKGTVIGSNTADFFGSGRLKMSDGVYKIASYYTVNPETNYLPRLENYGNYNLSGGTIYLVANNSTQIISGTPTYYNLKFSGSNTLSSNYIGISNSTAVATSIVISEDVIVDVKTNSFGMLPLAPTFTMTDNSRFITAGTGVKPDPTGTYSLGLNTTIEFKNNTVSTTQRPRLTTPIPAYANIVVSGSNVGNISAGGGPNSNLSFQPLGSFRVTPTGTYKLFNSYGFSGSLNTAIKSSNSPTITLEDGSTIEYAGANQTITHFNQNTNPSTLNYTNLTISGSGQKTLENPQNTFVNENLKLNSANLLVNTDEVVTVAEAVITTSGTMQIENNGQLIQINDAAINTGTGLNYKRTAQAKNFDYIYWSSPVDNFATLSLPGNNHYQWNTLFPNANTTQGNWETPSLTMTVGRGYIARASNGTATPQPVSIVFSGKSNNGIITIPVFHGIYDDVPYDAEPSNPNNLLTTKDDDNWNLVGNPYPSAIDAEKFLIENQSILEGAVHIWTHATLPNSTVDPYYSDFTYNYNPADYIIYNKLGSSLPNTFNGKIAAAQGFMVNMLHAAPSGTSIVFNNAMRYSASFAPYDNANFYRTQNEVFTEEKSRIWLDLVNTTTAEVGTILVGYAEEATIGKDHFYDCSFESRGDHSLYSLIDAKSFVIQGRSLPFNVDDIVPLGFSVNRLGDLAISIRNVDGIFAADTPIFLEDIQLNIFHDLKDSPYFFNSEIGTFNDRFQLRYGTTLSAGDFDLAQSAIQIIGRDGIVYLKSKENLIDEVLIYDVLGRLLSKSTAANTLYFEISLNILAKQAIIVKAKLANGTVVSKKIIF